ncbi:MAG: MOSC domain-containing protein [Lachnospiraceae bacterium]|nr:MOSC domain-containing protein [Lachnospiraceae bacterium]
MGKLIAICTSEKKGTQKKPVETAVLREDHGLVGDAHAGNWHRQVSLLGLEKIEAFREKGADVDFGAFGENLIIEGFDFRNLPVGTRFAIGDALLEMTQIGKECHSHCAIFHMVGDCIMPREGVFAKVLRGGQIKVGDEVTEITPEPDRPFTAAWITLSDKGSQGLREDESGPLIGKILTENGYDVVETILIPDDEDILKKELTRLADQRQVNLVMTTGGTGFAPRDITPEATAAVCERMTPGISEAIRAYSMTKTPRAMLSRAVSGIRGKTLIINLPGSPKAVRESMEFIMSSLKHGLEILNERTSDCARK